MMYHPLTLVFSLYDHYQDTIGAKKKKNLLKLLTYEIIRNGHIFISYITLRFFFFFLDSLKFYAVCDVGGAFF